MFVVEDEEEGALPAWALRERVIDVGDERFATIDRKVGVLAVGEITLAIVVIGGFYEGVGGEIASASVSGELGIREKLSLMQHEVLIGDEYRSTVGVNAEVVRGSLVEGFEDSVKQKRRVDGVLIDGADGVGAMHEHAVRDSGARDGGEPAVADGVLRGERGKDREGRRSEALHDVAGADGVLGQGVV